MLALLGSLLGFFCNTVPEFFKLFRDSQDCRHELAILDRQMEQQRLGHALGRGVAGLGAPGHHLCVLLGLCGGEGLGLGHLATNRRDHPGGGSAGHVRRGVANASRHRNRIEPDQVP